jgi:hypothetical protein
MDCPPVDEAMDKGDPSDEAASRVEASELALGILDSD